MESKIVPMTDVAASPTIRVLSVEDNRSDIAVIRRIIRDDSARLGVDIELHFWGEHDEEPLDVEAVQKHIEKKQDLYDIVLLDHAWSGVEDLRVEGQMDLSCDEIRVLPDEECPSSIVLLRRLYLRNLIPIVVFTKHNYDGWSIYVERYLNAELAIPKKPQNFRTLIETILSIYNRKLRERMSRVGEIIGDSTAAQTLRQEILNATQSVSENILVYGKPGVGKELVSKIIGSALSATGECPTVNITALPDQLIDAILFGHTKGIFTDASTDRAGLFESVGRGCLIIDEIGDLSLPLQAKLLRVANEREYLKLGETRPRTYLGRLVTSTNKDLPAMVQEGKFREDLLQRLRAVRVYVPELNDRREDIQKLAAHFLAETAERLARSYLRFAPEVPAFLSSADWEDGNVRSLRQTIDNAARIAKGTYITVGDIEKGFPGVQSHAIDSGELPTEGIDLKAELRRRRQALEVWERQMLESALKVSKNDPRRARQLLGLSSDDWRDMAKRKHHME